ncbi:MAG: thioredoxin family protein [Magnetococcales bacterium]|nr:thioredoxin family protein [Magnetococcales bacterium]
MILHCPACGTSNRIPPERFADQGRCGRCHAPLPPPAPGWPLPVDASGFATAVLHAPVPVLVDFHATWCGPCRDMAPHLVTIAQDLVGRLKVVTVDVDTNPTLAQQFRIQAVPTLILVRDGQAIDRFSGALPIQQLRNWIARGLGWL